MGPAKSGQATADIIAYTGKASRIGEAIRSLINSFSHLIKILAFLMSMEYHFVMIELLSTSLTYFLY